MNRYSFSSGGSRSALADLTIYKGSLKNTLFNVELKAFNVDEKNIGKDFEKLAKEEGQGIFFHILKNYNSGTFESLFPKYLNSLGTIDGQVENNEITIVILVLEKEEMKYINLPLKITKEIKDFQEWTTIQF